jgi:hypothetical protein
VPRSGSIHRLHDVAFATERVAVVAEARTASPIRSCSRRAENHIRGVDDFDDTVAWLTAYRDAGADAVYAPGLRDLDQIAALVDAVGIPVNVLALKGVPTLDELQSAGVRRVSTGGGLAAMAYGALLAGARELEEEGVTRVAELGSSQRSQAGASERHASPAPRRWSCCPISAPLSARPTLSSPSCRPRPRPQWRRTSRRRLGNRASRRCSPTSTRSLRRRRASWRTRVSSSSTARSGPPPWKPETRVYLSGPRAEEVAALSFDGVARIVVGDEVGSASAVKMSTASVYKGTTALLAQALRAAHANSVLEHVVADLHVGAPHLAAHVERRLAVAASKSDRYVCEMHEIAATQEAIGLTPSLFQAMAEIYEAMAETSLARANPEEVPADPELADVLERLRARY